MAFHSMKRYDVADIWQHLSNLFVITELNFDCYSQLVLSNSYFNQFQTVCFTLGT